MKTQKYFIAIFAMSFACNMQAQVTYETNDPNANPIPMGFLGWNDNTNETLTIRQNNWPRMQIQGENWAGYNSVAGVNNALRIWMPSDNTEFQTDVFSILHIGEGINLGFQRQWMNVGTTYGAGGDFMYTGMLQDPDGSGSQTGGDAVIAWGDNDDYLPAQGPDNLRFLFLSSNTTSAPGSSEDQGRETMRITPMGNVGIGDFSTMPLGIGSSYGQPRARLDVQFRNDIPDNTENTAAHFYNDVFANAGQTTINLKRGVHAIQDNSNGENIAWGIGGDFFGSLAKFPVGVRGETRGIPGSTCFGVKGSSTYPDQGDIHYGIHGTARFGFENIGVLGQGYQYQSGNFTAGVHGVAGGAGPLNNDWGGYFDGGVFALSGYFPSDENLKLDIQDVSDATPLLIQIQPKTFQYNTDLPQLNLHSGNNYGVMAQELEDILPELVTTITSPSKYDQEGNEVTSIEFKAIRYNDLIALLIAGFKEQNAEIAAQIEENNQLEDQVANLTEQLQSQEEQIAEMQNQMNSMMESFQSTQSKMSNCCGNAPVEKGRSETGAIELEQNFPNPFDLETTINFTIHEPAQIRLEISDASGRVLDVLVNTQLSEGRYTERWNAAAYAPGTYYYSLYANTELLTKKMIKR